MWVPGLFPAIEKSLALTKGQSDRLDRAVRVATRFAEYEQGLGHVQGPLFFQGSHASGLLVRPAKASQEFDVDVAMPISLDGFAWGNRRPQHILPYFAQRLRNHYDRNEPPAARPTIRRKNRCIRIDYVGEFHLDLVPVVVKSSRSVLVLDYEDDECHSRNHPATITQYVDKLDAAMNGDFRRSVRLLRRWRDAKLGASTAPSSLLLTILAGRALEHRKREGRAYKDPAKEAGRQEIDTTFTDVVLAIRQYLENYPMGILRDPLPVPGHESEDLDDSWPTKSREVFQQKLTSMSNKAWGAVLASTENKTRRLWTEILG